MKSFLPFKANRLKAVGAEAAQENGQHHDAEGDHAGIHHVGDKVADLEGFNVIPERQFRPRGE